TDHYARHLDIIKFERSGSDYTNLRYSSCRLAKSLKDIDSVFDYDFICLERVEQRLKYVDRHTVLQAIFARVTQGARSHKDKHLRILQFLHKASYHNPIIQPMYSDGTMVHDPLVLLELSEMRCGHVARVAVDLFSAGGYKGRLVQLGGHVIAEVQYDGKWHYF